MSKKAKSKRFRTGVSGKRPLRVPITNVLSGNDYSARVHIGSRKVPLDVILDTGSSTLAVSPDVYNAAADKLANRTKFAQMVEYGTGGWAGPLVNTTVQIAGDDTSLSLQNAHVAVTIVQEKDNFKGYDGILGLGYLGLNLAYDLEQVLDEMNTRHAYPWPFDAKNFNAFKKKFQKLLDSKDIPEKHIEPYFSEMEENGITANKFAFYALRSRTHHATANKKKSAKDPLNKGFLIIGGGEEQRDLYVGDENSFQTIELFHHLYYNSKLKSVRVDGRPETKARPLQKKYEATDISNAIIDTGNNILSLAKDVYDHVLKSLGKINPHFVHLIQKSDKQDKGIFSKELNLAEWPVIYFTFSGEEGADVTLACTPETYWQINTPDAGRAVFQIAGPYDPAVNQSVFGLPLMNNYYTVFDRSVHRHGVIRFAPIRKPGNK